MGFDLYVGARTRDLQNDSHARFKVKKDGAGILSFSNNGIAKIKELHLPYKIGDKVELHIDKESNAIAFKKCDSEFSVNLTRYGRVDSTRFQINSKNLATNKLVKEGNYEIEEPRKSESQYDFILYLIDS